MRKIKLMLNCLVLFVLAFISGCSSKDVDTFADVSNPTQNLNTGRGDSLTVGDVYEYIRKNNDSEISKNIMKKMMEIELQLDTDEDMLNLYKKYLNERFEEDFVNKDAYKVIGEFSEELVVKELRSKSYNITCENVSNSYLNNKYFACDYSDYIDRAVNYDVYLKMLKVKYIIDEKADLLNKNEGRILDYYSIARSSTSDIKTRQTLEEYVKSIQANYNSSDESLVRSLEDVAELKRTEELQDIAKKYEKISTASDDSFEYLNDFTKCGKIRCTKEEGKLYKEQELLEKDYLVNKIVINTETTVLYENARKVLFGNNISDYLYKIGDVNYLMSPAYENDGVKNVNDIILFDGSSTYYIVMVKVVDSNSNFVDKTLIAEMLIEGISEKSILDHYFEEVEIQIYDEQVRNYFVSEYGEY